MAKKIKEAPKKVVKKDDTSVKTIKKVPDEIQPPPIGG